MRGAVRSLVSRSGSGFSVSNSSREALPEDLSAHVSRRDAHKRKAPVDFSTIPPPLPSALHRAGSDGTEKNRAKFLPHLRRLMLRCGAAPIDATVAVLGCKCGPFHLSICYKYERDSHSPRSHPWPTRPAICRRHRRRPSVLRRRGSVPLRAPVRRLLLGSFRSHCPLRICYLASFSQQCSSELSGRAFVCLERMPRHHK